MNRGYHVSCWCAPQRLELAGLDALSLEGLGQAVSHGVKELLGAAKEKRNRGQNPNFAAAKDDQGAEYLLEVVLALELLAVDAEGEVLGELVVVNAVNAGLLELLGESDELLVAVELAPVSETTSPCVDGGDRVGRRLLALLVLSVVPGDGTVSSLRLADLTVGGEEGGGHEAETAEALSDNVGLNVTVVVLAGPHHTTITLDDLGDGIVDEAVLVPETLCLKVLLVLALVDLLEDVLELAVVGLEDSVLGGEDHGVARSKGHLEACVSEASDGLGGVVHAHTDSATLGEVEDVKVLSGLGRVLGLEGHGELALGRSDKVLASVLVTESVSSDDDGLGPARNGTGNVVDDDRLTEDSASEDVSDGAVGAKPHLLEVELLDTSLIGGDGGALDTDLVLLDGLGSIDGDLVVGRITVLHAEVVVLEVDVKEGKDELLADLVPDDTGHLITVELNDGVGDLDLCCMGR